MNMYSLISQVECQFMLNREDTFNAFDEYVLTDKPSWVSFYDQWGRSAQYLWWDAHNVHWSNQPAIYSVMWASLQHKHIWLNFKIA